MGTGGNSVNFMQGLDAIGSIMAGLNGSPEQMFKQQQLGINQGHLNVDQQKQFFTQGNAIALGDRFREAPLPKGRIDLNSLPLPELAQSGQLGDAASLMGAANRGEELKLQLSPFNYAANVYNEAGGDPNKMKLGLGAINFADTLASERQRRELFNKNDAETQMFSRFNVNAGLPQLLVEIEQNPNYTREEKDRFQAVAKSGGSVASAHLDPELKAKADVHGRQLALETGVAQQESDIKQAASVADIIAKAAADEKFFNRSTPVGATQYDMREAGFGPKERLAFAANEEIRKKQAERDMLVSSSPSPDTADGALIYSMKKAGATDQQIAAALQKPVIIPEGGSAILPQGSYAQQALNPSMDKVALAKQAEDTLTSMTKEELAKLPREQLIRLKQAINAGKSAAPTPIQPSEIAGRFPTKEEAPKSGQISYNGSIVSSTKLEKVDQKVDHEFDKLLDAYADVSKAIKALDQHPGAFGANYGLLGRIPIVGEMGKNLLLGKGETAARAAVFEATAVKKHEIYGAALTGGEQLDANNFLPSKDDNSKAVKEKLQNFQSQIYSVIERRMDTYHPYNGTHFLKSYENGRKMIDPASMTRAQQKNGVVNNLQETPSAPVPASSSPAPAPAPSPQRKREGSAGSSGFGVKG